MRERYIVDLSSDERKQLERLTRGGVAPVRKVTRARILLLSDEGCSSVYIEDALETSSSTVYRTRRRFVNGGLEHGLSEAPRVGGRRKLDAVDEAKLVALACSEPPTGRARWTLRLLADHFVGLTSHDSVSAETIRRRLREMDLKPWQKRMWCIKKVTPDFVARMESLLELYAEPVDPKRPLVCFDETLKQLVQHVVQPIPGKVGAPVRIDHHYKRNGSTHIAVSVAPHLGWRSVQVLRHRKYEAFAHLMKELVDVHFPDADVVRVVLDNLNVHCAGALYKTFHAAEARRILRRLDFHFTPVHASWLNMAEIELGALATQCLDRRISDRATLQRQVKAWADERNEAGTRIRWMFTVQMAREKLSRHYPVVPKDSTAPFVEAA